MYDYVGDPGQHGLNITLANADLIYFSGFKIEYKRPDTWCQGKLVDLGDISWPFNPLNPTFPYRRWSANAVFPSGTRCGPLEIFGVS